MQYEVKTYTRDGHFKKQITEITEWITFSEALEGGQGDLKISIVDKHSDYNVGDIVELREVSDEDKTIRGTYTGIIEAINIEEYPHGQVLELNILGVFTALNDIIYKSGASRKFTKNKKSHEHIQDIIDYFNSEYGALAGDTQNLGTDLLVGSLETGSDNLNIEFENDTCIEALRKVVEKTEQKRYVDQYGVVHTEFLNNRVYTLDKEITRIERKLQKYDMVNTYYLERDGGTVKTYQDMANVGVYGLKESYESDSSIKDTTTQDSRGNSHLDDYKYPRQETRIYILPQGGAKQPAVLGDMTNNLNTYTNNLGDIRINKEFLKPGDTITTLNTSIRIENEIITKIDKNRDFWTIYIGDFPNIGQAIYSLINN